MIPGALANHLWQSTVFAALCAVAALALRKNRAAVRHGIWLAASVKFLIPFSLLITAGSELGWRAVPAGVPARVPMAAVQLSQPFSEGQLVAYSTLQGSPAHSIAPKATVVAWASGSLALLCFWFVRWRRIRAMVHSSAALPLATSIPVKSAGTVMEPGVFGVIRPVLLLPSGITERLTSGQLSAILAHELCHARRRDNLTAALHMAVEAAFWFHPLVWWIGARLVDERERACDEEVLRSGSAPEDYAEGILNVCKLYLQSPLPCASGVTGSDLKKRIEAIMTHRISPSLTFGRKLVLVAAGAAAVASPFVIGLLHAQQPRATFEAAAIKPMPPYTGGPLRVRMGVEKGRINYDNVTLRAVVQKAYDVPPYLISGPSWITQDRYSINAKAAGPASDREMMPMLQTLLEERFHLVFHREPKEMQVYALVIGKNGHKLKESKGEGFAEIGGAGGGEGKTPYRRATIKQLAAELTREVDRPVVDMTGLTGAYDFDLEAANPRQGPDATGPSVFTAVQEQLGLRLEGRKMSVDTLVIDGAIRVPTEN